MYIEVHILYNIDAMYVIDVYGGMYVLYVLRYVCTYCILYNIDAIQHDCNVNHACFNAPKTNYGYI